MAGVGNTYFVNSVLQCIFHTLLLRGVIVEYGLKKLQHHEFYGSQSTVQKVVFMITNCIEKLLIT